MRLLDLIELGGVNLGDFKIHLATGTNPIPLEAFFDGNFRLWQEDQTKKNFQCTHILSLIHLDNSRWLFAGVYEVLGCDTRTTGLPTLYKYTTRELDGLSHLTGKAIVGFNRPGRASYLRDKKYADQLLVIAIREQRMTIGNFPGFNGVLLSHRMLKTLVRESNQSWQTVLSNVSGIYLITDTATGKHYVGSAYGGEGIWQRWTAYAKTGHGGNKGLRDLLRAEGKEHSQFFQFSLLEICDLNSSDDYVITRETHWKNVLQSRKFGLNKN
ncbi:MAG: GIY-YIG nuclease family protein [Candidatus Hydrogenedentes bacterium]|nr:GIY-YIG nuclease family protein [Candidatus Hydrogenedentota bacterium]